MLNRSIPLQPWAFKAAVVLYTVNTAWSLFWSLPDVLTVSSLIAARMNYDLNRFQRFLARLRCLWTLSGAATVLLTLFNVAVHGPRHLLLHLGLHAWLRVPPLRWFVYFIVGPISLIMVIAFGWGWLTYRLTTPADMMPVSGTLVEYGYDDMDRFVIVLDEYWNGFIVHATATTLFDAERFMRDVQPGEPVHLLLHRDRQHDLNVRDVVAAYEIRSHDTTFVGLDPVLAAEHYDHTVSLPRLLGILSALSAACWGLLGWEMQRAK